MGRIGLRSWVASCKKGVHLATAGAVLYDRPDDQETGRVRVAANEHRRCAGRITFVPGDAAAWIQTEVELRRRAFDQTQIVAAPRSEQTEFLGSPNGIPALPHIQLPVEIGTVPLQRVHGHEQSIRHLGQTQLQGKQSQQILFAVGQS